MQASDMHKEGEKNPYNYWADTERKKSQKSLKSLKPVQKHFYTNYKTNMMRDAHDIAKAVAAGLPDDPADCGDCKKLESPLHKLNLRNQWKSRLKFTKK